MKTSVVSGGFDPLHPGHLNLFRFARTLPGVEKLTVIVGSDEWVRSKHGRVMLCHPDRVKLVRQIGGVDAVHAGTSPDGDESDLLRIIRPDYFVVGPDHDDPTKLQEYYACRQCGIEIVVASGLVKQHSSSELIKPRWVNPPVTVSLVFRDPTGAVLVCERLDGTLDVPGGFLEPGESLEECCVREAIEEVGVRPPRSQLRWLGSWKDVYKTDGRQIVSAYFLWCGGFVRDDLLIGPEHKSHRWVGGLPDGEFFSESDFAAVARALRANNT